MWHANDKKSVGRSSPADYEGKRCSAVSYSTGKLGYEWCAAHKGDFSAFVTCGARDPGLQLLAKRLSEM